ncbi:pimeloyl-[acyl-carrier protein] methyl ester esterase [Fodinibius salinus]|uniref:Pimeloyl-[acyl-carrier protein] methyl ester esterase n=1 Tax=Fodinibius salinus TaxID=860790 RepID=A0A5D3YLR9_9BACT|nr:alpha/beta hydrolase [Fodinibius salinus]TYP95115.1 pimeloyl-[acyl-carrier protein] methyl ester esterase [Fodinibius salinus]
MNNCQIIAYHGWGFGADFWNSWRQSLSKVGTFQAVDRGYFNAPNQVGVNKKDNPVVFVAHSLGLHMIDKALFKEVDLLVVIGGFMHFHPYTAQHKRRSRFVLQEMINDLEVHPKETLQKFYENCFAPQDPPENEIPDINHELLIEDLNALQISERKPETLHKADRICIIHGADDHIVPNKKGRQIYNQCQKKAQYFELKDAGHALPITNHKQCIEFVTPLIRQLS